VWRWAIRGETTDLLPQIAQATEAPHSTTLGDSGWGQSLN